MGEPLAKRLKVPQSLLEAGGTAGDALEAFGAPVAGFIVSVACGGTPLQVAVAAVAGLAQLLQQVLGAIDSAAAIDDENSVTLDAMRQSVQSLLADSQARHNLRLQAPLTGSSDSV